MERRAGRRGRLVERVQRGRFSNAFNKGPFPALIGRANTNLNWLVTEWLGGSSWAV